MMNAEVLASRYFLALRRLRKFASGPPKKSRLNASIRKLLKKKSIKQLELENRKLSRRLNERRKGPQNERRGLRKKRNERKKPLLRKRSAQQKRKRKKKLLLLRKQRQ